MKTYKCHKQVKAFKITNIKLIEDSIYNLVGSNDIVMVREDFMQKFKPEVGGYYVLYNDGYTSYSPAKAFEEGYTELVEDTFLTRLKKEEEELSIKLDKLNTFMYSDKYLNKYSDKFNSIPDIQKTILKIQYMAMVTYKTCLLERIEKL